jgi:hypothetical protein
VKHCDIRMKSVTLERLSYPKALKKYQIFADVLRVPTCVGQREQSRLTSQRGFTLQNYTFVKKQYIYIYIYISCEFESRWACEIICTRFFDKALRVLVMTYSKNLAGLVQLHRTTY